MKVMLFEMKNMVLVIMKKKNEKYGNVCHQYSILLFSLFISSEKEIKRKEEKCYI